MDKSPGTERSARLDRKPWTTPKRERIDAEGARLLTGQTFDGADES